MGLRGVTHGLGAMSMAVFFTAAGAAQPGIDALDGVVFDQNLGEQRTNWTHARWQVVQLEQPLDLAAFDAIRLTITTDQPRADAGVTLALREADGTWRSHPWACDLTQATNTGTARFADFALPMYHSPPGGSHRDENHTLDADQITALAVGVVNPLGIGRVTFTVTRAEAVTLDDAAADDKPVAINITGELLSINGTDTVPAGLFGGFNLTKGHHERYRLAVDRSIHFNPLSASPRFGNDATPWVINSIGDRVMPSPRLTDAQWEEKSAALGKKFGEQAKEAGQPLVVEYWNEPYLNWANYNRASFAPKWFDQSKAEEGGPVHLKHDGELAPHLIWTRDRRWYRDEIFGRIKRGWADKDNWMRGRDEEGRAYSVHALPYHANNPNFQNNYYGGTWQPDSHPPKGTEEGQTYDWKGKTLTAFTPWHVVDTTQFTYWSGQGMLKFYLDPMIAFGKAMKEANPDSTYIIGWGNRPSEDHWAGWHLLYKPTMDAAAEAGVLDAINDHDYGGDPRNLIASYEVACAYGVTRYDTWVTGYNTECASSTDPQAYQDAEQTSADAAKFDWVSRKILYALSTAPDKAKVFLHFGMGGGFWSDGGEGVAMDLLRNVRGRLVQVENDDPEIYVVACIDGTDPLAPRPDDLGAGQELVVVAMNASKDKKQVEFHLHAPKGSKFSQYTLRRSTIESGKPGIEEIGPLTCDPDRFVFGLAELLPGQVAVLSLPLDAAIAVDAPAAVQRQQFFGQAILETVTGEQPIEQTITLGEVDPAKVSRAWLRIVTERLAHGEGVVTLNGTQVKLPGAVTPENTAYVVDVPLDPALLKAQNTLRFATTQPHMAGYLLGSCSLIVETR